MSKGRKKPSLHDLTTQFPSTPEHTEAFIAEIRGASDRACALLAVSMLDRALEALLATQMHGTKPEEQRPIFYGLTAILGSFSSKIRMSYVMSLISKEQCDHLNTMREIRNSFAHSMIPIAFETPEIATECAGLWNESVPLPPSLVRDFPKPRAQFMARFRTFATDLPNRYTELFGAKVQDPILASRMASYILSTTDSNDSNS